MKAFFIYLFFIFKSLLYYEDIALVRTRMHRHKLPADDLFIFHLCRADHQAEVGENGSSRKISPDLLHAERGFLTCKPSEAQGEKWNSYLDDGMKISIWRKIFINIKNNSAA